MAVFNTSPTRIDFKTLHFLIMDCPSESTLGIYLQELRRQHVSDVVRVCDPTYSTQLLEGAGIQVHDLPFVDGEPPPQSVIQSWLNLCHDRFERCAAAANDPPKRIAVHCVAGLGRAPVLVALALIEEGMEAEDAVQLIRRSRKGAINSKQLRFLQKYKPRSQSSCCVVS